MKTWRDWVFLAGMLTVLVGAGVYGARPLVGLGIAALGGGMGAFATWSQVRYNDRENP